ncbi:MAG: hypothetical protein JOY92_17845 [Verrucomicrobia bacterium]|nr:hypothetical protein [Verrucomicrobiota bacterium]
MMDPNTYVLAAVLDRLRQRQKGKLPAEPEFTPFNLSWLRHARRDNQPLATERETEAQGEGKLEALA